MTMLDQFRGEGVTARLRASGNDQRTTTSNPPLDEHQRALCDELGLRAAEFCRDDAEGDLPVACPLTTEMTWRLAAAAGLPWPKLGAAAVAVLDRARARWQQILSESP
jgi:hypothetical protein